MVNIVEKIDDLVPVRLVLVSVSDKSGLSDFIPGLVRACPGVKIISTGGTFARIEEILGRRAKTILTRVSDYTGQPETQGGLVKTLDFKIYLGLLTETYNPEHKKDLKRTGAAQIDMAVLNLYPFKKTVAKKGVTVEQARANIDIGGPAMVRASAKNFLRVASVTDPADYRRIIRQIKDKGGKTTLKMRYELARKAFKHTADYDRAIAAFLARHSYAQAKRAYPEIK